MKDCSCVEKQKRQVYGNNIMKMAHFPLFSKHFNSQNNWKSKTPLADAKTTTEQLRCTFIYTELLATYPHPFLLFMSYKHPKDKAPLPITQGCQENGK